MHRTPRPVLALAVLFLTVPALAGCLGGEPSVDVLATFYPMTFLAESIAGDDVTVGTLITGGAEPHDWEPAVSDVTRLSDARLVVAQHPSFEPWLDGLVDNLGSRAPPVVYTAEHLIEGGEHLHGDEHDDHDADHDDDHDAESDEHGNETGDHANQTDDAHGERPAHLDDDPHTWVDPVRFADQAVAVLEAMMAAFPEHTDDFVTRTNTLLARLDATDTAYTERLANCETRHIVTQHDAFAHQAHRYNFTVHAVSGLSPEAEPDPAAVDRIIQLMRQHGIETVFVEPLVDRGIMQAISRETGATVATLNPLESRTSAEAAAGDDHIDILRNNLDALADAMRCT